MAPKGKQGTKGQKQIVEENNATLKFYKIVIIFAIALHAGSTIIFFRDSMTIFYLFLTLMSLAIYSGSYWAMKRMSDPTTTDSGLVVDCGIDLNMKDGMAEHLKDLILLTAAVTVLSLISNYFWLLILLAPARALYLLWVNFLGPWFFAEAPEVDDKKAKKMERKMKRRQ